MSGTTSAESLGHSLAALLSGLESQVGQLEKLMPLRSLGVAHVDMLQQLEMALSAAEADAARSRAALRQEAEDIRALR
eukprot:80327-Prymnesium_polylepis.1